jgi:gas vesicle protein
MSDDNAHGDLKFMLGLFIGGIIGAVVIFFLGTKEGKKTSKLLEEKGRDLVDDIEDKVTDLGEKGKDIKEKVIEQIEEKKEEVSETATEKLDSALADIEKIQEQGIKTTADLRKRIFRNTPKKR